MTFESGNKLVENTYAVIIAGGKGTRFWPLSREKKPKQVLSITNKDPMIRATVDRILPVISPERILVITGEPHAEPIRGILTDIPDDNIIIEPIGRNTAPCIGLAAEIIHKRRHGALMAVLPADHVITRESKFLNLLKYGLSLAEEGAGLITLGVKPTYPETGYGYIEVDSRVDFDREPSAHNVLKFHEKPELKKAVEYLETGRFFWNSGMFIWKTDTIRRHIRTLLPDVAGGLAELAPCIGTNDFASRMKDVYPSLTAISIDYGIMEKADDVLVIPADIGWNDVGSWQSAAQYWPEENGNAVKGDAIFIESKGCAVYSREKLTVLLGMEDHIVVDTPDVLMVCPREKAQDVGNIVKLLEEKQRLDLL